VPSAPIVAPEEIAALEALTLESESSPAIESNEPAVADLIVAASGPVEMASERPAIEAVAQPIPALMSTDETGATAADVQPLHTEPMPAPVKLPEGMVMVETNPGRTESAPMVEVESDRRRTPRAQPAALPQDEDTLVQIETRK
jgi:hypothetical protein